MKAKFMAKQLSKLAGRWTIEEIELFVEILAGITEPPLISLYVDFNKRASRVLPGAPAAAYKNRLVWLTSQRLLTVYFFMKLY